MEFIIKAKFLSLEGGGNQLKRFKNSYELSLFWDSGLKGKKKGGLDE